MELESVFWLALAVAALVSAVYVIREVRRLPKRSLRPRRASASWVLAALVAVRIAQGVVALIVLMAVIAQLYGGGISTRMGTADAVALTGDGSISVRGEAGYMVGLCSGQHGARGAVAAEEICGDPRLLRRAVGGGTRVHQVVVQRAAPEVPGAVWVLFGLGLAMVASIFVGLEALARMLVQARRGVPFSAAGTRSLRVLAAAFVVGGAVLPAISDAVTTRLVERYLGEGAVVVGDSGGWLWPTFVALMLLALAEIWRFGIRLQDDAEGVV